MKWKGHSERLCPSPFHRGCPRVAGPRPRGVAYALFREAICVLVCHATKGVGLSFKERMMKAHRRILVGMCALAAFLLAGVARAQVLSQVPQDALVVIKLNNPEGVSKKLAAFAQK